MNKQPYVPSVDLVDLLLDAICVVDKQGCFVFVSAACERIFGYTPEEMLGRNMIELVFPEDRARTLQAASEIMAGTSKPSFENRYVRKDGQIVHIMWSARWSADDQLRIAVAHDISERKHSETMQAALYAISEAAHLAKDLPGLFKKVHSILGELLPAINFSVALYDEQNDQLDFPYHIDEQHQAPAPHKRDAPTLSAEIIRSGQTLLRSAETLATLPKHVQSIDCSSLYWLGVPLTSHNGTIGALVVQSYTHGERYTDKDKELLQFVSTQVASSIERQQMLTRLQFMAQYDALTHLPNRALLHDRMHTALARAHRVQTQLSVLFLDLDKFKQVNDTFGHATGDLLLQMVANRLKQCIRESDTVARLGGDEFVILIEDFHSPDHALLIAEKIRVALNQPFELDGQSHTILPSIGVAFYPQHGDDAQQLLNHADNAMYVAKKNGGNCFQVTLEPSSR
jgi:diguanylate cyclase (GGDEF)-like protein/PAS domain S-box-containing protein